MADFEPANISLETRPAIQWESPVLRDDAAAGQFEARMHYIRGTAEDILAITTDRAPNGATVTIRYSGTASAYQDYIPEVARTYTLTEESGAAGYLGEALVPFQALDPPYHRRHREVTIDLRAPSGNNNAYIGPYNRYTVILEATKLPPFFGRSGWVQYDADDVQQQDPISIPFLARDGSYVDIYFSLSDVSTNHVNDPGDSSPPDGTLPSPQPTGTAASVSMETVSVPIAIVFGEDTNAVEGTDFEVAAPDGTVFATGATVVEFAPGETSSYIRIRTLVQTGDRKFIRPRAEFNNYGLQVQECPFSQMGQPGSWGRKTNEYDARYDQGVDGGDSDWWIGCHNFPGTPARYIQSLLVTDDGTEAPDGGTAYLFAPNPAASGFGCALRQFFGDKIGGWEKITQGNLSEDPTINQNHLSVYVKKSDASGFTISILDRTKQGESDPTASKNAVFSWTGDAPQLAYTDNLGGTNDGAGIEIHGRYPSPAGWYRAYIHYETSAGEDGDVTQYVFRPANEFSGDSVEDGKGTYMWGAMFERNALPGNSGRSDYQPYDHNQWHPQENCRAAATEITQYIEISSLS